MNQSNRIFLSMLSALFLMGTVDLVLPLPSQAEVDVGGIKKILKKIFPPCGPGTKKERFVVKGEKVCDNKTGLWWQKTPGEPPDANCANNDACTWQQAIDYCTNLELTGNHHKKKEWRLPEVKELSSLVDYSVPNQADNLNAPTGPFMNVQPNFYWSAMEVPGNPTFAWSVLFGLGSVGVFDKVNPPLRAWCVSGDKAAH